MTDVYVLDNQFEVIDIIDNYTSLIWASRYTEIGDCELYVEASDYLCTILVEGNFLQRSDDDMICRIEKVELTTDAEQGDFLAVTGYDIKKVIYNRVITKPRFVPIYSIEEMLVETLQSCFYQITQYGTNSLDRGIDGLSIRYSTISTEPQDFSIEPGNLGDFVTEYAKAYDIGIKMYRFNNGLRLELYYGNDLTDTVIFSDNFDNLKSTKYALDSTDSKNAIFVTMDLENHTGSPEKFITTDNATGFNRKEIIADSNIGLTMSKSELDSLYSGIVEQTQMGNYVTKYQYYSQEGLLIGDATIVSTTDIDTDTVEFNLTSEFINKRLTEIGNDEILKSKPTSTFEGEVEPEGVFKYKTDYTVGDLIRVENKYKISREARIIEVVETFDDNGHSIALKLEYKGV